MSVRIRMLLLSFGVLLLMNSKVAYSEREFVKNEYVIKFKDTIQNLNHNKKLNIINMALGGVENIRWASPLRLSGNYLVKVNKDVSPPEIMNLNKDIEIIEPNYIYRSFDTEEINFIKPEDKRFNYQWSFQNTGQRLDRFYKMTPGSDMKILKAWNDNPRSIDAAKDLIVAVIDTGINEKHEDLIANLWKNPGEHGKWIPQNQDDVDRAPGCWDKSCNKLDDDGNGIIDDLHGGNWSKISDTNPPTAKFHDDQGHGTHCAGVIGAKHNKKGISGINDTVQLMALKFLSKKGEGTLAGAIESINYAIDKKANVINASWGGPVASQILRDAIQTASNEGILFVAAAGNSSLNNDLFNSYPANYNVDGIISVAATEFNNKKAFFTNHGAKNVDVSAPGHKIYSTFKGKKGYSFLSGTSMAAPHVAGLSAMLMGLYPDEFLNKPVALKNYIIKTSTRANSLNWLTVSGGIVNASNAVLKHIPVNNTSPERRYPNWLSSRVSIRSSHPYEPNMNKTYELKSRGAKWIKVKFGRYALEEGVDQIELYDGEGNLFDTLTGFGENKFSRPIKGDKVVVKFITDSNVNDWGYEIVGLSSLRGEK